MRDSLPESARDFLERPQEPGVLHTADPGGWRKGAAFGDSEGADVPQAPTDLGGAPASGVRAWRLQNAGHTGVEVGFTKCPAYLG